MGNMSSCIGTSRPAPTLAANSTASHTRRPPASTTKPRYRYSPRQLLTEGVGVGHVDAVPGGQRVDGEAAHLERLVGLGADHSVWKDPQRREPRHQGRRHHQLRLG
jgi:hypothetical protein